MGYTTEERIDGTRDVVFMYRVGKGIAQDSFGVECGRMAGLPEDLLRAASERSAMMREVVKGRVERNRVRNTVRLISVVRGLKDRGERVQPEGNHSLEPGLVLGMMRKLLSQVNDT